MNTHACLNRIGLPLLAAGCALVGGAAAAAPANADSIVYAKQGNLYLTSPDGSKGYQLTFDRGYLLAFAGHERHDRGVARRSARPDGPQWASSERADQRDGLARQGLERGHRWSV